MHPHPGPVLEGLGIRGQIEELAIEHIVGLQRAGCGHHHAAFDLGRIDPLQVDGGTVSGLDLIDRLGMHLNTAHLGHQLAGIETQFFTDAGTSGDGGAGDHRAEALHGEDPVHRQAERTEDFLETMLADEAVNDLEHLVDPFAGGRRDEDQRGIFQKTAERRIPGSHPRPSPASLLPPDPSW